MGTKGTSKAGASKKESSKKMESSAKTEKKTAKPHEKEILAKAAPAETDENGDELPADPDEIEEEEESASGSGGNAAALAAAGGPTEMSASFKNFRHHPDMENFYRFIFENDLRHEALAIIDEIMVEKQQRKQGTKPAK